MLPTPQAYPRTDLKTFIPWTSILNDINQCTHRLPSRTRAVESEERVRIHAEVPLHDAAEELMAMLGVRVVRI